MAVTVTIEQLKPGMVLAEPIFNRFNQVLLNKGVAITDRHLNVLSTWGIPRVIIEGGEREETPLELDNELKERGLTRLKKRLLWTPKSLLEEEIIHLAFVQACQHTGK
jgi:hypothetical protein